jgi:hypothetical protein
MASSGPDKAEKVGRRPVVMVFTSHWLAMTGLGLLLTSFVMWACLLPIQLKHGKENPYIGLATAVVGGVFVLGLLLTPLGLHLGRRRLESRIAAAISDPPRVMRRLLVFLGVTTVLNLVIASQLTVKAIHSLDSRQFCGTCHEMTPEARAFTEWPHAGILCVDCHVGNGALGFIQSKIQGTKQLWSVLTNTVPKPIVGAIEAGLMVPSAETCEECHWKERPTKATIKLYRQYGEDETNTPTTTLLTMNVGGSRMGGIHGSHNGEGVEIRFVATNAAREEIPLVEYRNARTGVARTYLKAGADEKALANQPRITMQCFDCHNRPAHAFEMPDRAVDRAISLGRMSSSLPFLKKTAMEVLKAQYSDSAAAAAAIPAAVTAFYAKSYPEASRERASDIEEAGRVLADIYSRNVFPEFGVTWGLRPNFDGHSDTSPGCFRCHDGDHKTATGEKISNDCFRCHFPAAVEEAQPEVLKLLGVDTMLNKLKKK